MYIFGHSATFVGRLFDTNAESHKRNINEIFPIGIVSTRAWYTDFYRLIWKKWVFLNLSFFQWKKVLFKTFETY